MPHVIIEHSSNLSEAIDLRALVDAAHVAALETGVFPVGGLRTRCEERTVYRIADGDPANGFVHVTMRIGAGRDEATRKRAAQHVFDAVCRHLAPHFERAPLAISLEMEEIAPATSFKRNNLHEYVKRRGGRAA